MFRILFVLALLFSSLAHAEQGDLHFQTRLYAHHFGTANNNVPAIGLEYEAVDRVKLGYLYGRNSMMGRNGQAFYSNWLMAQYVFYRDPKWDLSAGGWVADGYNTPYNRKPDIKYSLIMQACHNTTETMQICGNLHGYSTNGHIPSAVLYFKFKIN